MAILALATSGPEGEVGLQRAGGAIAVAPRLSARSRGREIAPRIAELLAAHDLRPSDLQAVAVDVGPGSFTGVRVGVATAKGLAFALDIPVVPLPSLEILAAAAPAEETVLAVRDAGRETYYFAVYGPQAPDGRPCRHAPTRAAPSALRDAAGDAHLVGEDAPAIARRLDLARPASAVRAGAHALLALAARRLQAHEGTSAHAVVPLYLQPSAPERRRAGKEA